MNLPATLMWARRMDDRPVRITFTPPAGSNWKPATQLFPTADAWTFTAPNLQYLFDSPTELSAYRLRAVHRKEPRRQDLHDPDGGARRSTQSRTSISTPPVSRRS